MAVSSSSILIHNPNEHESPGPRLSPEPNNMKPVANLDPRPILAPTMFRRITSADPPGLSDDGEEDNDEIIYPHHQRSRRSRWATNNLDFESNNQKKKKET